MLVARQVLSMVDPEFLTAGTLAAAIDAARPPAELALNLDGARQSAATLIAAWKEADMSAGVGTSWDSLARECDAWAESGRRVELWWRDDDAIADTPALRRLIGIATVPLALAVIPAGLEPSLPAFLKSHHSVGVLQHGFDHRNRAPPAPRNRNFRQPGPGRRSPATLPAAATGWPPPSARNSCRR